MLIRSIRAENFMRFEQVLVEDLPERGVIGLEGANESGKSTLGELVVFALFGHLSDRPNEPVGRAIRWGAESLSVELRFAVAPCDGGGSTREFMLYREIDRGGTNYVRIVELPARKDVATGNLKVQQFVAECLRFDYEEFQDSFYHSQHELRAGRSGRLDFLEQASGISDLRLVKARLMEGYEEIEHDHASVQKVLSLNRNQIVRLQRGAAKLTELRTKRDECAHALEEAEKQISAQKGELAALKKESKRLEGRAAELKKLASKPAEAALEIVNRLVREEDEARRTRAEVAESWKKEFDRSYDGLSPLRQRLEAWRDVRAAVAARVAELGQGLDPGAEVGPQARLSQIETERQSALARRRRWARCSMAAVVFLTIGAVAVFLGVKPPTNLPADVLPILRWGGGVVAVGSLIGLICSCLSWSRARQAIAMLRSALEECRRDFDRLRQLQSSLADAVQDVKVAGVNAQLAQLAETDGESVASLARAAIDAGSAGTESSSGDDLARELSDLAQNDRTLRGRLVERSQRLPKELDATEKTGRRKRGDHDRLLSEIRECESQEQRAAKLLDETMEVELEAARVQRRMDTRLAATRLVDETIAAIRAKVAPALTALLKVVLPRVTAGQYRDVKVDDELTVRVFSSTKSDFLALGELSGGTQEALRLAMRLALSQAFVASRLHQAQFVFLDEPFKMMDDQRAAGTLEVLRELSPDLRQIFVSQPNFGDGVEESFVLSIRLDPARHTLHVRGDGVSVAESGGLHASRDESADTGHASSPGDSADEGS